MRTNSKFIHEFDEYAQIALATESADRIVNEALANCYRAEKRAKYSAMFENTDSSYIVEEAKQGLFEKIGDAIKSLIANVVDAVKSLFSKIKGNGSPANDTISEAKKILNEHPESKDELLSGLEEGKYDIGDLEKLRKGYQECTELLAEEKIDTSTFKGKIQALLKKFDKEPQTVVRAKNFAATVGVAVTLLGLISKTQKETTNIADTVNSMKERFHRTLSKEGDDGTQQSVLAAFYDASKLILNKSASESVKRGKLFTVVDNFLKKVVNKYSKTDSTKQEASREKHRQAANSYLPNARDIMLLEKEIGRIQSEIKETTDPDKVEKLKRDLERTETRLREINRHQFTVIDDLMADSEKNEGAIARKEAELKRREKEIARKEAEVSKLLADARRKSAAADKLVRKKQAIVTSGKKDAIKNYISDCENDMIVINGVIDDLKDIRQALNAILGRKKVRSDKDHGIQEAIGKITTEIGIASARYNQLVDSRNEAKKALSKLS